MVAYAPATHAPVPTRHRLRALLQATRYQEDSGSVSRLRVRCYATPLF